MNNNKYVIFSINYAFFVFLFLPLLLFLAIPLPSHAQEDDIQVQLLGEFNPAISRFLGFTAVIPSNTAQNLDTENIKFFVNGDNQSYLLQVEKDPSSGDLVLIYKPVVPLPLGKVVQRIVANTRSGDIYDRHWFFIVNPASHPSLAPWASAVQQNPRDVNAYMKMGKIYEEMYLPDDALGCYKKVLELDPNHQEAERCYNQIFALMDHKFNTIDNILVEVNRDQALEKMGYLALFKITVVNKTANNISFSYSDCKLMVDDQEVKPLEKLTKYPYDIYKQRLIDVESYARLSYFMETHPIPILDSGDIIPNTARRGYATFGLRSLHYNKMKLILKVSGKEFQFPFGGK